MPREISDEEYTFLQSKRQIADFVEGIYNNPKFKNKANALIKEAYPNIQIPEHDIEARVDQRLSAIEQARKDQDEAAKNEKADADWKRVREETKQAYGYNEEAMQRLEKLMLERNIGDYEVAATYLSSREPKASDPTYDQGHWHHERQENFKDIVKDPESWARNELIQAMRRDEQRAKGRNF